MTNRYFTNELRALEKNPVAIYASVVFGAEEVDVFTFQALADSVDGDYCVAYDTNGLAWAVALDTTGGALNTPTGAAWVAIPSARKVYIDISFCIDGTDVASAVKDAFTALTGFTSVAALTLGTATVTVTALSAGAVTAPGVHNKNDSGAGTIAAAITTAGTANALTLANSKGVCKLAQTGKGKYTLSFGTVGQQPTVPALDTYYKVLSVSKLWDTSGIAGAAPAAPLMYLTNNSVAVANTASVTLQCTNSTGSAVATNPAAGARLYLEFELGNSSTY